MNQSTYLRIHTNPQLLLQHRTPLRGIALRRPAAQHTRQHPYARIRLVLVGFADAQTREGRKPGVGEGLGCCGEDLGVAGFAGDHFGDVGGSGKGAVLLWHWVLG